MAARQTSNVHCSWSAQADKKHMGDLKQALNEVHRKVDLSTPLQAPYSWLHAHLRPLKEFVRAEIAAGNYVQVYPKSLD